MESNFSNKGLDTPKSDQELTKSTKRDEEIDDINCNATTKATDTAIVEHLTFPRQLSFSDPNFNLDSPNSLTDLAQTAIPQKICTSATTKDRFVPKVLESNTDIADPSTSDMDLHPGEPHDDDIQEYISSSVIKDDLKNKTANLNVPLPTDHNANHKTLQKQPTLLSLDPGDSRPQRVDILWRVPDNQPLAKDESVSNCTFLTENPTKLPKYSKFYQKQSRYIPSLNRDPKSEKGDKAVEEFLPPSSQTQMDPNDDQILVATKKSDEEQGNGAMGRHGDGGHQGIIPEEKLTRRETFNWPCHSGRYHMNIRFHDPEFRALFSCKMLFLKALQWIIVTGWTIAFKQMGYVKNNSDDLLWTLYVTTFLFTGTYLCVRSTNFVVNQPSSYIVLLIYAICLAHLAGSLYVFIDTALIPMVLITLALTYSTLAMFFLCFEELQIDSQSQLVFYPVVIFTLISSIISFWGTYSIRHEKVENVTYLLGSNWFPCLIISTVLVFAEMVEIQALLSGTRTPLEPTDYALATTFLF